MGNMFEVALQFGSKLLDKMPNYDQKKREEFFKLKRDYQREKAHPDRDDDQLLNLKDKLEAFMQAFAKDIE
jgi:hypothetical protein